MNKEIINRLMSFSTFSGRNGAFEGRMTPTEVDVDNDSMIVLCEKDGREWEEHWDDLQYTVWAFERGDYYFITDEENCVTADNFEVHLNIVDDVEPNEGGFYVEIEIGEQKVDDFCIHPEDCDCSDPIAVALYAKNYVQNLELQWDGKTWY